MHVQFFVSKKRKPLSPVLKSGRNEKDVKVKVEGSPSAKGTLDNYLLASQENNMTSEPSYKVCDSLAQQDQVRRNLTSEIDNSLKDEFKQLPLSSQLHSEANDVSQANQKETSRGLTKVGDVKEYPAFTEGEDRAELKDFAADFLSLYCRYCTLL